MTKRKNLIFQWILQTSNCLASRGRGFSLKSCSFFVFVYFLFIGAVLGLVLSIIIFVLKPREPLFSLKTVRLDAYDLEPSSSPSSPILVVSCIVSLTLNAQNPNRAGIRYLSSRLRLLHGGLPIGEIKVPRFCQPANSRNATVTARVFLRDVNVSQLINGASASDDDRRTRFRSTVQMKILGDIRAHVQLLHVTFPKFRVALDCDIGIDYRGFGFTNQLYAMKAFKDETAPLSPNTEAFSKNCTLALYL
ncbi:uncharacterized protein LOC127795248 isoform X2 [Diospyros lotus]|uniref:uncharacterized protein LOC127795248 isoform X2 n=1 Tax=Diospyros lotus TaxID=55363 RepID=UPI00225B7479|nr:uncharacterized protein LOC127795248 isoform X2 [Diospyros lotus]